jgi:peptidoglycan/LPS O-acetylase OafA/YrhL
MVTAGGNQRAQRRRIGPLTTIRFAAAIFVVFYHTLPRPHGGPSAAVLSSLLNLGYTAVSLFFVLSGFILAVVYPELPDRFSVARFWLARVARIYPMYALSLFLDLPRLLLWRVAKYGVVIGAFGAGVTVGSQLAMIQAWMPRLGGLNYPSWSVATEMFFYLAFPALLPVLSRPRGVAANLALLALLCGTAIALSTAVTLFFDKTPDWAGFLLERSPIFRLTDFACGAVLASLYREIASVRNGDVSSRLPIKCLGIGLAGFGVVATLAPWVDSTSLKSSLLIPSYALIILGLALARNTLARVLSFPLFVLLGEASYVLYLIHAPAWAAFENVNLDGISVYTLYIAFLLTASIALHLLFERPLRRAIISLGTSSQIRWLSALMQVGPGMGSGRQEASRTGDST